MGHYRWASHSAAFALAVVLTTGAIYLLKGEASAPGNCFNISMPPVQYDNVPQQNFIDMRVNSRQVDGDCRQRADFSFIRQALQACVTKWTGGPSVRIVPNDVSALYQECLIRHENGHLNGWAANHPGARWYTMAQPVDMFRTQSGFTGS